MSCHPEVTTPMPSLRPSCSLQGRPRRAPPLPGEGSPIHAGAGWPRRRWTNLANAPWHHLTRGQLTPPQGSEERSCPGDGCVSLQLPGTCPLEHPMLRVPKETGLHPPPARPPPGYPTLVNGATICPVTQRETQLLAADDGHSG